MSNESSEDADALRSLSKADESSVKAKKRRSSKPLKQDEARRATRNETPVMDLFGSSRSDNLEIEKENVVIVTQGVAGKETEKSDELRKDALVTGATEAPESVETDGAPEGSTLSDEPRKIENKREEKGTPASCGNLNPASRDDFGNDTTAIPAILASDKPNDAPVSVSPSETSSAPRQAERPVEREEESKVVSKKPAYQVVARRYRPQTFEELIGQETIARALTNAIETNRVGHAYLFTGARGVGKTSCARIFAKALNCVHGPTTHPCLRCDNCLAIATGEDVDVIEIDGASNRGVDEIRQLRQNAAIAPSRSHYKIYIIDEVHMLTREAFNALLKTLEEPPTRVKFIFCTTEPNKIPITILSRCQRFDFNSINGTSISKRLEQIALREGADAEDGVFDIIARRANGSMRDAQSLLEQLLSFAPTHITMTDAHNMLGSVDDKKLFDLLQATLKNDAKSVFEVLGQAAVQGIDFGTLVEQMFGVFRDLMVVASGCPSTALAYVPVARFDNLKKFAESFGMRRILASLQILDQTLQRMRFSAQARILAEIAFARLCSLDVFQAIESLIAQLKNSNPIPVDSSDGRSSTEEKKNSPPLRLQS